MLNELVAMSNRYGANPDYVLAGGGNTSWKDEQYLYVKASGTALADIAAEGFVKMDRAALNRIFTHEYPEDSQAREAAVLRDMLLACCNDIKTGAECSEATEPRRRRPSVEALVHTLMPQAYVLHVHPARVNGMTCGRDGPAACARLFPQAMWVPQIMPGYILAKEVFARMTPGTRVIFLENHGVFIGGDTVEEIDAFVNALEATLSIEKTNIRLCGGNSQALDLIPAVRALAAEGGICVFRPQPSVSPDVSPAVTPDHMVYCHDEALYLEHSSELGNAIEEYRARNYRLPKIICLKGCGIFACGRSKKEADIAMAVFLDAIAIYEHAKGFGGAKPMDGWLVREINHWEVEHYRKNISLAAPGFPKRLKDKIAIITGGAQGFGLGLAEAMADQGAYVTIADINGEGAQAAAANINRQLGAGRAMGYQVDVTDEAQVKALVENVVLEYGGLDIFVSNAGIVRSGGVCDFELSDFELSAKVNYAAYFLCVKHAARIMKQQNQYSPGWTDIIQVNSKSGLEGSNRNFAYAGSKFGGLGLTQSFALELAGHRIKVNSICPGNFLDGPLWCDPENGLFVQYLHAGKVPGAKTVEDVKRAYEAKVPMNRGCTVEDVARALFYVVEQQYETGQAIPVTGGQVMLK